MTTATYDAADLDVEGAVRHLSEYGYVLVENLLDQDELAEVRDGVADIFAREREAPFEPGDGPRTEDDDVLERYMADTYKISEAEHARVMRRIRHTRAGNLGTPWPVPPQEMNKNFLHLPTLFDNDSSQRIWNLPKKLKQCPRLIEDATVLRLARSMLGEDCVLSDIGGTSIGPRTKGGAWHIDAPLTQLPEPLPEVPMGVQNVWILDDFTADNGATRVLPGSHLSRKKPGWGYDPLEGEVVLEAPAGSMAIWSAQTWHRSGPNSTDNPRPAVLGFYCPSWVKPFQDFTKAVPREVAAGFSPTVRYLLGWSASGPVRG